jgi:ketosteroid isomerase-like protein
MDARSSDSRLEAAIDQTRTAFVAALRHGDAKAAARVYADGAKLLAPSAELIKGLRAIEAFWQAGVDSGICDVELDALELERRGRLAYEIGSYALRLRPADGETVVDRGKYLLIHARQTDGSWRWAVEMFNPDTTSTSPNAARKGG